MASFDLALEELRAERFKLEADLKTTDLRKLVLVQVLLPLPSPLPHHPSSLTPCLPTHTTPPPLTPLSLLHSPHRAVPAPLTAPAPPPPSPSSRAISQELALLKEFEKNDIALASRLERKHAEKSEIVSKVVPPPPSPPLPHLTSPRLASPPTTPSSPSIHPDAPPPHPSALTHSLPPCTCLPSPVSSPSKVAECQEKLAVKKVEIERLLDKDKQIMAEMHAALGDSNKYSEVTIPPLPSD